MYLDSRIFFLLSKKNTFS